MYLQANQRSGTVLLNVTAESAVIGSTKHNNCCYDFQTSITNIFWNRVKTESNLYLVRNIVNYYNSMSSAIVA